MRVVSLQTESSAMQVGKCGDFGAKVQVLLQRCPDPKACDWSIRPVVLGFCNRFDIAILHEDMMVLRWKCRGPNGRGTMERLVDQLLRLLPKRKPRKVVNRRGLFVA